MLPLQYQSTVTVAGTRVSHGVGYKTAACCKSFSSGLSAKGLCLGLGLGMGIWGPIALVGVGVVGGYYYWKKAAEMLD